MGSAQALSPLNMGSFQAPRTEAQCLPEGKRLLRCYLDFTLPSNLVAVGNVSFPEFTGSGPFQAWSVFTFSLGQLANTVGLTEFRSVIYYLRPFFQGGQDLLGPSDDPPSPLLTNLANQLTVGIPAWNTVVSQFQGGQAFASGAIPFFGNGSDQLRVIMGQQFSAAPCGRLVLHFANFDIHPFNLQANMAVGD